MLPSSYLAGECAACPFHASCAPWKCHQSLLKDLTSDQQEPCHREQELREEQEEGSPQPEANIRLLAGDTTPGPGRIASLFALVWLLVVMYE